MSRIAAALFLLAACAPLSAATYLIEAEYIAVDGRTKISEITKRFGSAQGRRFESREELEAFAAQRARALDNLRLFQSSSVVTSYGAVNSEGVTRCTLTIFIKDGSPVIPIPYAIYNSNMGFLGGVYLKLPGVAGTLQSFQCVGMYNAYYGKDNTMQWANPNFEFFAQWLDAYAAPFLFNASAFATHYNSVVTERGEAKIVYRALRFGGELEARYPFLPHWTAAARLKTTLSGNVEVSDVFDAAYYDYGPDNSRFEGGLSLEWENIIWRDNFRKGFRAELSLENTVFSPRYAPVWNDAVISAHAAAYTILGNYLSPLARASAVLHTGKSSLLMGKMIRGVIDNELKGDIGIYLNTGVQTRLFKIGKTEAHLIPTFDIACVYASEDSLPPELALGAGGELVIIDERLKSFPIRLGFAYDLRKNKNVARRVEVDFNMQFSF